MTSTVELARIAQSIRVKAGQRDPAFSTRALVRAVLPNLVVTGRVLPPGVQGVAVVTNDGPVILYARGLSAPEQRLVIAHELGHHLFDAKALRSRRGLISEPRIEARADAFAAELLCPLATLRKHVHRWPANRGVAKEFFLDHVDEISSSFGVPSRVIDQRVRELASLAKRRS